MRASLHGCASELRVQKISRENLVISTKSVNFSQQQGVRKKLVKQDKQPAQYHGGSRHLPPSLDRIGMVEAAIRRRSSAPGPDGQEDCVGLWQKAAAFAASATDACVPATLAHREETPPSSPRFTQDDLRASMTVHAHMRASMVTHASVQPGGSRSGRSAYASPSHTSSWSEWTSFDEMPSDGSPASLWMREGARSVMSDFSDYQVDIVPQGGDCGEGHEEGDWLLESQDRERILAAVRAPLDSRIVCEEEEEMPWRMPEDEAVPSPLPGYSRIRFIWSR